MEVKKTNLKNKSPWFSTFSIIAGIALFLGVCFMFMVYFLLVNRAESPLKNDIVIDFEEREKVDKIANWKVYQNENYGFELKYPEDWYVYEKEYDGSFYFQSRWEESELGPHTKSFSLKIEDFFEGDLSERIIQEARSGYKERETVIGGEPAILVKSICEDVGCGFFQYYLVKNNRLYVFDSNLFDAGTLASVVSTFKFVEFSTETCSKEGDLALIQGYEYPYNKARITSKEGYNGGRDFVINDSDFVLEGINLPEAEKITVEWEDGGKVEQVENFERGDTHWCFEVSKEKGNLNLGVNLYMVRIYFAEDEIVEYSVKVTWNDFAGEILDEENLYINWLDEIKEEPVENFFSEKELDSFYTDCNRYDEPCYNAFSFYRGGSVSEGAYKDYGYYLVSKTVIGHGEMDFYYRMLFNSKEKKMIILEKYSNEPDSEDKGFFVVAKNIIIDNLLPKEEISIPNSLYVLEPHSESPNYLFSNMIKDDAVKMFTDVEAGDVFLHNSTKTFFARVPDGSVMIYRIKMPFAEDRTDVGWKDDFVLNIEFLDGKQNLEYYSHGSRYQFVCAGGFMYDIVSDGFLDVDTQLKLAGKSSTGEDFYEINDEQLLKQIYEEGGMGVGSADYHGQIPYAITQDMTFDEFLAFHPLLFWKDPFGRWIQFTNNIFSPAMECGGGLAISAL